MPGSVYSLIPSISVIVVRSSMATGKPFFLDAHITPLSIHCFFTWCPLLYFFSFENLILYISAVSFDPPVFHMIFFLYSSMPSCVKLGAVIVLCVIVE